MGIHLMIGYEIFWILKFVACVRNERLFKERILENKERAKKNLELQSPKVRKLRKQSLLLLID